MKKNILIISFLVSSVLASWTNKVSDRLLNPQNYFKKQKLKIQKKSIPKINNNGYNYRPWIGEILEGELECVIYTTNEGKYILLTDDEYNNMPEGPYKGLYRKYKISKTINDNNLFNKLTLFACQSTIDGYNNIFNKESNHKKMLIKFLKGTSIVSIKMAIRKENKIYFIYNINLFVDGIMLSKTVPIAYRSSGQFLKKENNKWLVSFGYSKTLISNLKCYFAYNEDATKLVVKD